MRSVLNAGQGALSLRTWWRRKSAHSRTAGVSRVLPVLSSPVLSTIESDLNQLNRSTESDFLAIGGMLTEFISSARQISAEISVLSEFISGEKGEAACGALASVLSRARQMRENTETTNSRLVKLSESARHIHKGFSSFHQTVSSFRLVATLARIETERLGNTASDLGHLPEEFRTHTDNVVARVSDVLADVTIVQSRIDSTIVGISGLQRQKLQTLPSLVANVEANLAAFRNRQAQATAASAALAAQFTALSAAIAGIVGSIQFHDITRQQIEHVAETLADSSKNPSAAILRLQAGQLESAQHAFVNSIGDIDSQLETIAAHILEMVSAHKHLLDRGEGESFFLEMERCFEVVLDAVGNCDGLDEEVSVAMSALGEVLCRLNTSLDDIRSMALQVKWLAINARINAIRLGVPGEPLNIVAEAIQGLQSTCEDHCEETGNGIASMKNALEAGVVEDRPAARGGSEISAGVRARIGELHSSSQGSSERWQRINGYADALRANIQSARDRLSVGQRASETLDRCGKGLRDFASLQTEGDAPYTDLERIARRYTMQSERDVHERITGIAQQHSVEKAADDVSPGSDPGGFGDDIELF